MLWPQHISTIYLLAFLFIIDYLFINSPQFRRASLYELASRLMFSLKTCPFLLVMPNSIFIMMWGRQKQALKGSRNRSRLFLCYMNSGLKFLFVLKHKKTKKMFLKKSPEKALSCPLSASVAVSLGLWQKSRLSFCWVILSFWVSYFLCHQFALKLREKRHQKRPGSSRSVN